MINPNKLNNFIDKKRESLSWIKTVSEKEIDCLLNDENIYFKTRPFFHQKIAVFLGMQIPKFMFLIQPGLGKTKIFIDLIANYQNRGYGNALIVVPRKTHIFSWMKEFGTHSDKPIRTGLNNSLVDVVDYGILQTNLTKRIYDIKTEKNKYVPDSEKIAKLKYDILIIDESHNVKTPNSLRSKIVEQIAEKIPVKFGGTGTVFTTEPLDLWNQFHIVDNGRSFTNSYWFFRECFHKMTIKTYRGRSVQEWVFDPKMKDKLNEILDASCLRYSVTECYDLPEKTRIIIECDDTKEIKENDPRKTLAKGKLPNVQNVYMRSRTVASGLVHVKNEEANIDYWKRLKETKIENLCELLEEIGEEPVIIFYKFIETGKRIMEMLKEMEWDKDAVHLKGGMSEKETNQEMESFHSGRKRIVVSNLAVGAEGHNFQRSRYLICVELPDDPKSFVQMESRIYRTGQKNTCIFYYLLTKGSIEYSLLENLQTGRNFLAELMKAPELLIELQGK